MINKFILKLFYLTLILFLIFFLNPLIVKFFGDVLNEYFSLLYSSWKLDVLFISVFFLFASITINNCSKSIPNLNNLLALVVICVFYFIHRHIKDDFEFLGFSFANSIKYLDILYPLLILYSGYFLKFLFPKKQVLKNNNLLSDDPITINDKNLLEEQFVKLSVKISEIIKNNSFRNAYTIGINCEWGGGKTSLLNFVKNEIHHNITEEETIVVNFNPWLSFESKNLIEDFFNSILEKLNNDNLYDQIASYSASLVNNNDNSLLDILKKFVPFANNAKSLETIFDNINKNLKILNQKLVIFIDDVDRLDNDEIFQLLKLVRNTANFSNTFFVIAYDRDYVDNAIKNINSFAQGNYLDKIVNTEFNLPYYDKALLKLIFKDLLLDKIDERYKDKLSSALDRFNSINPFFDGFAQKDDFGDWISNIREVKKLVNSIYINFNDLLDEINFDDAIYLEILRLKYPSIYRILYTQKNIIFYEDNGKLYIKNKITDNDKRNEEIENFEKSYFKEILDYQKAIGNIYSKDIELIIRIFRRLFNYKSKKNDFVGFTFEDSEEKKNENLNVNNANKFERYFSQNISRINISEKDFDAFLTIAEESERKKLIQDWVSDGKEVDLIKKIEEKAELSSKTEFENIVKTIFQLSDMDSVTFTGKINLTDRLLLDKLALITKDKLFKFYTNEQTIKDFLISLFESYKNKYASDILYDIYNDKEVYYNTKDLQDLIGLDEIHNLQRQYFFDYLQGGLLDKDFWTYFHGVKKVKVDNGKNVFFIEDDIKEAFKQFIIENNLIKELIESMIERNLGYDDMYVLRPFLINFMFDNYDGFIDFIKSLPDAVKEQNAIIEFLNFYELFKNKNYKNYIKFNFQYLFN